METEPKNHPSSRPKGGRRMEDYRRGSPGQGPGTKTEAGNCPGEQDRATPDQHRHHKFGRRKRGPKEPQSRSRSHARASASATPILNTRMTASTSQRRHGVTARVRPTHGTRHRRHREPGPAPSCPGIRSQKEKRRSTIPLRYNLGQTRTARTGNRCSPPSRPGKPDRAHRLKTISHAIILALTGPGQ